MSLVTGLAAETKARDYLINEGLTFVESNYRCRLGEIDLIMRDKDYWVFVEVRARASDTYGSALESVTYHKQQKLLKTASLYLLSHKLHDSALIRFDVISIEGKKQVISWIRNAFGA